MPTSIELKRASSEIIDKATLLPGELAVATDTGKVHTDDDLLIISEDLVEMITFDNEPIETVNVDPGEVGPFDLSDTDVTLTGGSSFAEAVISGKQTGHQGLQGMTGPVGLTGPTGDKGIIGDQGSVGQQGPGGEVGADGPVGQAGKSIYDGVIRTQAEFDQLVSSPNWLGYHSVMFDGQFYTNKAMVIPPSVFDLVGINGASIHISEPEYHYGPSGRVGYQERQTDAIYSMANMTFAISSKDTAGALYGCENLTNVTNCRIRVENIDSCIGFYNCSNLRDCAVELFGQAIPVNSDSPLDEFICYESCSGIINCTGKVTCDNPNHSDQDTIMFLRCNNVMDCQVDDPVFGAAFDRCDDIINCKVLKSSYSYRYCNRCLNCHGDSYFFVCNLLTNCEIGRAYNCSYLNGCKVTKLEGTNTKVDALTVLSS